MNDRPNPGDLVLCSQAAPSTVGRFAARARALQLAATVWARYRNGWLRLGEKLAGDAYIAMDANAVVADEESNVVFSELTAARLGIRWRRSA